MPPRVRRLGALISLVLVLVFGTLAQQNPTTVDVMLSRISKAKALVAIKNYAAAIYELEGIKRETNDPALNSVAQVMLMNCYLEQLDYKRAQALLTETFNGQKINKAGSNYFAVAGQVVREAKSQLDRYKSLGLSVADRNLPTEAVADVEKMRETVEMVVTQSKTLGENKKLTADSMALLEEAGNARSNLARDDYDARRWKDEVADARERLTTSRSTIINTVDDGTPATIDANKVLASTNAPIITLTPEQNPVKTIPVSNQISATTPKTENPQPTPEKKETVTVKNDPPKTNTDSVAQNEQPKVNTEKTEPINKTVIIETPKEEPKKEITKTRDRTVDTQQAIATNTPKSEEKLTEQQPKVSESEKDLSPLQVGSLIDFATSRVNPTYPPTARTMRTTGTVKVEVLVNEDGTIAEVQKKSGPSLLQQAAVDAIKRWKFKPFMRAGQPVKATGFVNFNFNL